MTNKRSFKNPDFNLRRLRLGQSVLFEIFLSPLKALSIIKIIEIKAKHLLPFSLLLKAQINHLNRDSDFCHREISSQPIYLHEKLMSQNCFRVHKKWNAINQSPNQQHINYLKKIYECDLFRWFHVVIQCKSWNIYGFSIYRLVFAIILQVNLDQSSTSFRADWSG